MDALIVDLQRQSSIQRIPQSNPSPYGIVNVVTPRRWLGVRMPL